MTLHGETKKSVEEMVHESIHAASHALVVEPLCYSCIRALEIALGKDIGKRKGGEPPFAPFKQ